MTKANSLHGTQDQPSHKAVITARIIKPAVNICEDETGVTLVADVPGASKDKIDIQVNGDALTIEAGLSLQMPDSMRAIHMDVGEARYKRSFSLGKELDANQVDASLKDGVLNLYIPKREELRPRKIEVRAA